MIFIIIPVYNRKQTTLECLHSLHQQTYCDYHITIVDDGSTDGTANAIYIQYPLITILHGDGNLWWAGAMHKGITYVLQKATKDDYVLGINDDVIVEPDYLSQLLIASKENNNAVVGSLCKDVRDRKKIFDAGITIQWKPYKYGQVTYNPQKRYTKSIDTVSGRGVLIPISVIKWVGNVAQNALPHYGADYEYGLRIKFAGIPLVIANKAIVYLKNELTGFRPTKKILSYAEIWKKLFSIRSPANIFVHLRLVWLYSPTANLRLYNLIYLLAGNAFLLCKHVILYTLLKIRIIKNSAHEE